MDGRLSLNSLKKWLAVIVIGLIPIIFLPVTQDFYDTNKLAALAFSAGIVTVLTGISLITRKKTVTIPISPGVIAFGSLFLASTISLFIASTNKIDALMAPLGPISLLSLLVLTYTLHAPSQTLKNYLSWIVTDSMTILGLIAVYQFFGMGRAMFPRVPFIQDPLWTPAGTSTTFLALSAVTIAFLVPRIRTSIGKPHLQNTLILSIVSLLVLVVGGVLTVWQFIPKFGTSVMPLSAAWAVMLKVISRPEAAIGGVGVENFVTAYTMGKPLSLLSTGLWNIRFLVNANFFLHMTTVYGLFGGLAAIVYALEFVRNLKSSVGAASIVYLLSLFIVPPSLTLLAFGVILFVLADPGHDTRSIRLPHWTEYVLSALFIGTGVTGLYFIGRAYLGERQYFLAISAAQRNEGTVSYTHLLEAIQLNPRTTRYRITNSQISLLLANGIAAQNAKQDTSADAVPQNDENKKLVGQLVEQAINEAKVAVTLNYQNVYAWENLGSLYQTIMPLAPGADQWAAAAYEKARVLDPTNPIVLFNYGGALVHEKKYNEAITAFNRAINLKPDYTNAYYNLANAYLLKGDIAHANEFLTQTISLLPAGSADYTTAKNLLDALENGQPIPSTRATPAGSQLTLPQ